MTLNIKTPNFFYRKTIISYILWPFSFIFGIICLIVYFCRREKRVLKRPKVICVGNFIAGGSGKTPVCMAIAEQLSNVCFLTCGYGRKSGKDIFIKKGNLDNLTPDITGDEPLLLAEVADVFIVKNQHILPEQIENYDYVVCDDDLWDKSLKYDVKIAVLSKKYGFGNGFILPGGPLRTFKWLAKVFSDYLIVINDGNSAKSADDYIEYFAKKNKVIYCSVEVNFEFDKTKKYLAFAGLGNNDKFFDMLINNDYNVVEKKYFPDHYVYTKKDIELLEKTGLTLITTEKDFVKIKNNNIKVAAIKIAGINKDILGDILSQKM